MTNKIDLKDWARCEPEFSTWSKIDQSKPVDYHLHTSYTDGTASVQKMAGVAVEIGLVEVLFSEHVRRTSTYFPSFVTDVRGLGYANLKSYAGVEAKILSFDGHLDCPIDVAQMCDVIIGSVHSPPAELSGASCDWRQMDVKDALRLEFSLAMAVLTKSEAHILGHPMGMVITYFNFCPLEHLYKLARACCDFDKVFELNARYCASPGEWIDIVRLANCKVSLGSDSHGTTGVGSSWNMFMENSV